MLRLNYFQKGITYLLIYSFAYFSVGCASYTSPFVYKTEEELEQMEATSAQAHTYFEARLYDKVRSTLESLCTEQTVSRPLYQLELLSVLLMEGKREQAHELMVNIQRDLELLFDPQSEKLATSFWHGETNKVFKGEPHERAIFYAFLAMSFIERGEYEDALRSVKNGLLADISTEDNEKSSDFAILHYLGYIAARYNNDAATAEEYKREYLHTLQKQGYLNNATDSIGAALVNDGPLPNTFLVLWSGSPPTYLHGGTYDEIRHILPGNDSFSLLSVETEDQQMVPVAWGLGDVNFQATTRGGREMDEVLKNKATLKRGLEASSNILLVAGAACFLTAATQNDANTMLLLAAIGGGCVLLGSGFYFAGACVNSKADIRAWRNLPGTLSIIPLYLPEGEQLVKIRGYYHWDNIAYHPFKVNISNQKATVQHISLLPYHQNSINGAYSRYLEELGKTLIDKDKDNFSTWMNYEITD